MSSNTNGKEVSLTVNVQNPGKSYSVLLIDDDSHMLLGLRALLERSGYIVTTCDNSPDGIKMAGDLLPDLIVCDIMMPLIDGYAVREKISADPLTHDIPFLFLSARASQNDKIKGFEKGADDYVTKPFDPRELVARIDAVLRRQEKNNQNIAAEVDRQISRIQAEISHNISHELRTPMMQILMSLEMVLREKYDNPEELKWFVETALSQSHRLNSVIDDLTFLNSYDTGKLALLRQKVDVNYDFLSVILTRLDMYKEKGLRLDIHAPDNINIHAPRREFRQIVSHLVDNSLKFSEPMSVILVDLQPNGESGAIITITDYGPGIPEKLREKVFERFYQISQGDARAYNGLGVGLTISRIIARGLNGDVVILPSSRGCRVQVTIPSAPLDIP